MDDVKLRRFVELEVRRRDLEGELKAVSEERGTLEESLLEEFSRAGIQNVRVNGLTVYLHSQLWAGAKERDYARACAALEAAGLGSMVDRRFNTNTLSAWIRERVTEGEDLPDALKNAIEVTERFSLRTRKEST